MTNSLVHIERNGVVVTFDSKIFRDMLENPDNVFAENSSADEVLNIVRGIAKVPDFDMSRNYRVDRYEHAVYHQLNLVMLSALAQYFAVIIDDFMFRAQPAISGYIVMDIETGMAVAFDAKEEVIWTNNPDYSGFITKLHSFFIDLCATEEQAEAMRKQKPN